MSEPKPLAVEGKINRWVAAFQIFSDAGMGDYDLSAEHDVIYVRLPSLLTTSDEGIRLQKLGWGKDESGNEDEDESWYHYV